MVARSLVISAFRLLAVFVFCCGMTAEAIAERSLTFDVAATLDVQDVTTPEFTTAHPQEKLLLLSAHVSLYVAPTARLELHDVVITLDSPAAEFQVVDFLPKTTLDSRFAGNVSVNMNEERRSSLDFDATGYYKAITGAYVTGSYHDEHSLQAKFQMLPPRELVMASGTVQRGRGVYFKLKASSQNTIEGEKVFVVIARVPRSWRGDVARVRCEAHGREEALLGTWDENSTLAQQDFLVALYLSGDELARQLAERFIAADDRLRMVAQQQQRAIERDSTPKLLRKVGISSPAIPANWLYDWRFGQARAEVAERLPSSVREMALRYTQARAELHRMNGEATTQVALLGVVQKH